MIDRFAQRVGGDRASRRDFAQFTPKLIAVIQEGYSANQLKADMLAGLTVAIIALPLAMALAIASGAAPNQGLVTAIVAGLMVSLLGGSRVQIGGPTGAFVVVVFNVIAVHGYDGLVLATAMAGLVLIVAGYAGLGRVIRYIPHPVITGFTAGIAVIIASSQIRDFLGLRLDSVPAEFIEKWRAYGDAAGTIDPSTFAVGAGALALIIVLRRFAPRLPAFLIVVIAGSLLVAWLGLKVDTIGSRFPDMPSGLPLPVLPTLSLAKLQAVLPSALTIAFLAGIESLLSCVVSDGMTGFRHRSNQELVGQGFANIASALFGGLPATGALARTAANVKSGGRTPFAGMFHAGFLLLFVLFASKLMAYVPMAVLAALLFVVAWGMSEAKRFLLLLRMPLGERAVLVITFLLTIIVDLTVAIGVGVTLASLMFMARMSERGGVAAGGDQADADEDLSQRDQLPTGVEVFRIYGPFFFGVAGELLGALKRIGRTPQTIILRLELVPFLDASGAISLEEFLIHAKATGIRVILSGIQPDVADVLGRASEGSGETETLHAPDYATALALAAQ
ncbi:MAG: STAS domain-containing protein [Sphingomonas bacterium]|nr:STAS domain-containing protein [Sphingomonas bacterium]